MNSFTAWKIFCRARAKKRAFLLQYVIFRLFSPSGWGNFQRNKKRIFMARAKKAKKMKASSAAKAVKPVVKTGAIAKALNKSQLVAEVAECGGVAKKQASQMLEALSCVIGRHLKKGGAGECTLPGLMKLRVVRKPATKARKGVNPFTGEPTMFKAKPARNVVKVRPLKKLKAMAA